MHERPLIPAKPSKSNAPPAGKRLLQRKCACAGSSAEGECEECKKKEVQRKAAGPVASASPPPIVREVLESPGQPLDGRTRAFFEAGFGHDFSKVRVHTDEKAAQSARDVSALAYTVGKDVVFGGGQYAPATVSGQSLLAHELAHVTQQASVPRSGQLQIGAADDPREAAAERMERGLGSSLGMGRSGAPAGRTLQRKDGDPDIQKMDWAAAVTMAEKAAADRKTINTAEGYYKQLVVRAARNAPAPSPLKDKKPEVGDVRWSWTKTKDYGATTDPRQVDKTPDDYWKWITFNPSGIVKDEAFTASVIFHELDHAAHAKALFDEWKKSPPKGKQDWVDFYSEHFGKWTEKPIKVKKSGLAGTLAGLPEKITPSGIEFRAYVNQFVTFFHKVSLDNQAILGKQVVLFYPLKVQKVSEKISDPTLDVSAARQLLLDYFKSPPVDKARQEIIKNRIAMEFKSALSLFRPDADQSQMRKDFKEILDFPVDREKTREISKSYKPEPL